jgi:transposase
MMGTKIRDFAPLPDLSLEELVPEDNFYRRLEVMLDLSFVRELVRDCYASGGRPSIDPVVFFRLQLVMFFEDIRSERQLMEVAADRLSIRWYLGYDLDEPLPDHSSLTRIRERYGLEIFRGFFEKIVQMCVEAGLVRGEELFFDSTKVRANADVDSLRSRSIAQNRLKELFEEPAVQEIEDFATPPSSPDASAADALPTAPAEEGLKENNAQKSKDWISRAGKQDRSFSSGPRKKRTADRLLSTTDPDATPMHLGSEGETKLGYPRPTTWWTVARAGDPQRLGHSLGGQREPAHARPPLEDSIPLALVARARNRGRQVRHHRERRGRRAGEHPGVCGAAPERGQAQHLRKGGLHLRPQRGRLRLPSRKAFEAPGQDEGRRRRSRGEGHHLPGQGLILQGVRAESEMHLQQAGAHPQARSLRRVPESRKSLSRDLSLREGLTKEAGVGRAAFRRGQRVARDEEVPTSEAGEGEHRSFADRLGAERQAAARLRRSRTEEAGTGTALRPPAATGYKIAHHREHRAERSWPPRRPFFNRLGRFWYSPCPTSDRMCLLAFLFSTTICCGYPQHRTGATPLYRIRGAHLYSGSWIGVSENLPSETVRKGCVE